MGPCKKLQSRLLDCRAISTDRHGAAWIGSEAGNVKRIDLCSKQVTGSETKVWLEHNLTLRHVPKSRRSSTNFSHAASADMDELAKTDLPRKCSGESIPGSEGGTAGNPSGVRAHNGPVTAVETKGQFVFSSGGSQSTAVLHQWGQNGMLHRSHKLGDLGENVLWQFLHAPCPGTSPAANHQQQFVPSCLSRSLCTAVAASC